MKGHWCSIEYSHECACIHIDYMITMLLSLFFSFCLVCVCRVGLRICVSASDEYISMKRKKPERKKKSSARPLPLRFSARVQVTGDWCIEYVSICVCLCVVARHRRPKGIRWSKEKKGEKTETDMQSKAIEGVPVVCTRAPPAFDLSLSRCLSSLVLVESSHFLSLSFGSCWFNLRGLLHHYHRPSVCRKEKS
jgi:hypothetical protein